MSEKLHDEALIERLQRRIEYHGRDSIHADARTEIERLSGLLAEARDRLQISPYGDDKIDEQEVAIDMLRHRAEKAEAEVRRVVRSRDKFHARIERAIKRLCLPSTGPNSLTIDRDHALRILRGESEES